MLVILGGLLAARDGGRFFRDSTKKLAAELGAIEVGRGAAPDGARIDPLLAPQLTTDGYFLAVDKLGDTPAWSVAQLRNGPQRERVAADEALARVYDVKPAPFEPTTCRGTAPRPSGSELPLAPGGRLLLRAETAGSAIRMRRFSSFYPEAETAPLPPGETVALDVPRDRVPDRWTVRLDGGPVTVC